MVITSASVIPKVLPPLSPKIKPYVKYNPIRPKIIPKKTFLIKPYYPNPHIENLQHIENRSMYIKELAIDRGRTPMLNKALIIHTNGSLNEIELETTLPPLVVIFRDRYSVSLERKMTLQKSGRESYIPYYRLKKI